MQGKLLFLMIFCLSFGDVVASINDQKKDILRSNLAGRTEFRDKYDKNLKKFEEAIRSNNDQIDLIRKRLQSPSNRSDFSPEITEIKSIAKEAKAVELFAARDSMKGVLNHPLLRSQKQTGVAHDSKQSVSVVTSELGQLSLNSVAISYVQGGQQPFSPGTSSRAVNNKKSHKHRSAKQKNLHRL